MTHKLQIGDELQCPHCGRWHQVFTRHSEGTAASMEILFWQCRGKQ